METMPSSHPKEPHNYPSGHQCCRDGKQATDTEPQPLLRAQPHPPTMGMPSGGSQRNNSQDEGVPVGPETPSRRIKMALGRGAQVNHYPPCPSSPNSREQGAGRPGSPLSHQEEWLRALHGGMRGPSPKTPVRSLVPLAGMGSSAWTCSCRGPEQRWVCKRGVTTPQSRLSRSLSPAHTGGTPLGISRSIPSPSWRWKNKIEHNKIGTKLLFSLLSCTVIPLLRSFPVSRQWGTAPQDPLTWGKGTESWLRERAKPRVFGRKQAEKPHNNETQHAQEGIWPRGKREGTKQWRCRSKEWENKAELGPNPRSPLGEAQGVQLSRRHRPPPYLRQLGRVFQGPGRGFDVLKDGSVFPRFPGHGDGLQRGEDGGVLGERGAQHQPAAHSSHPAAPGKTGPVRGL